MYEKLIHVHGLEIYVNAIRILSKGCLPISLLPSAKLKEILDEAKKAIQIINMDYDIVIKRSHLDYDMKLVTPGINKGRNLIVQFQIICKAMYATTTTYTESN